MDIIRADWQKVLIIRLSNCVLNYVNWIFVHLRSIIYTTQRQEQTMNKNGYAQTQGMNLLGRVVESVGPLFTTKDARNIGKHLGLKPQRVRALLSQLAGAGWIERLKRGSYVVTTPVFHTTVHPYAIAEALVSPIAISHWSALAYHGFTTQIPPMTQATTTSTVVTPEMRQGEAYRPRGRAVWRALNMEFEFIQIQDKHFFGFQEIWVSEWHRVSITNPERTILDLFAMPQVFGSLEVGLEVLETELHQLHMETLVAYALRYEVGAVIKRIGWSLEMLDVSERLIKPLQDYPLQAYSQLDPTGPPGGKPVTSWQLRNNLQSEK
jgi:predicted transcriptional regulator of viral defense system